MTYLRRIAQLISDLRELNVIQETDNIEYLYEHGWFYGHQITIKSKLSYKERQYTIYRYDTIYHAFLKEFSPVEICQKDCNWNRVMFTIRDPNKMLEKV